MKNRASLTMVALRVGRPGVKMIVGIIFGLVLIATGCGGDGDVMGPSSANCVVIFASSDPPGVSGIEVHNETGGGLLVQVDGVFTGAGAHMGQETCEVWAYPAGTYQVTLQRCEQADPSSSGCTSLFGPEVIRSVVVQSGSRTVLRIDENFFS